MTRLTRVEPFSMKKYLDRHKSEIIVCLRLPAGIYLMFFGLAVLLPAALTIITTGHGAALVWGVFCLGLAALCELLAVRILFTSIVQLLILRSLKTHHFSRTKKLCLQSMRVLKYLPLGQQAELSFYEIGLGAVCMSRAEYEEAEQLFSRALERNRNSMNRARKSYKTRYYPNMAVILSHLSRSYSAQGKFEQADRAASEALEFARSTGRIHYARMEIFPLYSMAFSHLRSGAIDEAEKEYNLVIKVNAETKPLPTYGSNALAPILMACRIGLAIIAIKKGNIQASHSYWDEFVEMANNSAVPTSPSFLNSFNLLANELINAKQFKEAEAVLDFAYSNARRYFDHPDAIEMLNYYEKLMLLTGRQSEVKDMRAWLRLTGAVPT